MVIRYHNTVVICYCFWLRLSFLDFFGCCLTRYFGKHLQSLGNNREVVKSEVVMDLNFDDNTIERAVVSNLSSIVWFAFHFLDCQFLIQYLVGPFPAVHYCIIHVNY